MTPPRLVAGLLGALVVAAPALVSPALALPKYRTQAAPQLHLTEGNALWQLDRRVMPCTYCHVDPAGGPGWNPFGQALQRTFAEAAAAGQHLNFPQALSQLLAANTDADGDSYADALEVFAKTLPGDPQSKPETPVADLAAAFEQAGGVAQYAPLKKAK
ncbi:hypothetical protein [Deinococcus multiflagellatus]|uniref:hypothetical protein n=1 Tax=Deinococcus multiflagellatus TaxID=1656887 RepID=UPI001CC9D9B0|nr:hypothetical protein [Deinococcus multiflagellatus]MBZ9713327.1 hypothetical protein [Deinococcus multiflagellatus]